MTEKLDKTTTQYYLNKITQDFANIQAKIAQYQQDIEEAKRKIVEAENATHKYVGALNYTAAIIEAIKKDLEQLEKDESDKPLNPN